jgi:hypothetical protein
MGRDGNQIKYSLWQQPVSIRFRVVGAVRTFRTLYLVELSILFESLGSHFPLVTRILYLGEQALLSHCFITVSSSTCLLPRYNRFLINI